MDWVLIAIVAVIFALSLVTFYFIEEDWQIVYRQIYFIIFGFCIMGLLAFFDYRILKNYSSPSIILYVVAIILLALALMSHEIRGASSWLVFGGFRFESSEFAKLALLVLLAKYFSQKHVGIYRLRNIVVSGIYVAIPATLTLFQPDLGSMLVYGALWIGMLLYAGIKRTHLFAILMIGVIAASIGWFAVLKPYQRTRIVSFVNPYLDARGTGYNTIQSRVTLGSGQVFGTLLTGQNKTMPVLVPEPYTDFIFAAFGQKFGLVGIAVLLALFLLLFWRIGNIGMRTDNNFAKLFALGFMTIIFFHVIINGGMNLGIMPITGIPFPFLSHGGSHLVILMAGLGILQSIRAHSTHV